jgi:exopolyphosphatase/guanosine-5'-triphosphate,3'-diphosphate pyrophosphatase
MQKIGMVTVASGAAVSQFVNPFNPLNSSEQSVNNLKQNIKQEVVRASLEIGSGQTKLTVGVVDTTTNQIEQIWYQNHLQVKLRQDLAISENGCLSEQIENRLIAIIQQMKGEIAQFAPEEWAVVATSVFRTAKNGVEFLKRVEKSTGIAAKILSQTEEAQIGFATAKAVSREMPENIITCDCGSGSFQISRLVEGKLEVYGAEYAFAQTLQAIFTHRNQPFVINMSPNPVSYEEALKLIDIVRSHLPPTPTWLQNKNTIVTFGDEQSSFKIASIATGKSRFTKNEIFEALVKLCGKNDEELTLFPKPDEVIPVLVLIYTIMDHSELETASFFPANGNCEGLLISPYYWPKYYD